MAQRHWVGGTNTWDGTAGSKWALTSGGAGGQAVPTSSDDVFFDSGSGAAVVTIASGNTGAKSIDCTGFTGTLAGSTAITVAGSFKLVAGMTFSYSGVLSLSASSTLTSGGKSFSGNIQINTGTLTLGSDFVSTASILMNGNSVGLNDGGFNLKALAFNGQGVLDMVLTGGATTWEFTGDGTPFTFGDNGSGLHNPICNFNTANVLKFTSTSANALSLQLSNGNRFPAFTIGKMWFSRGSSTAKISILGNMTFSGLQDNAGLAAHTLEFSTVVEGATYTLTNAANWLVAGVSGKLVTLVSTIPASFSWTLSCSSGTLSSDYLSVSRSTGSGGAAFYAGANSTNGGSNSGWIFTAPPVLPTVTTQAASSIGTTTGTGNGNITATGGANPDERGVVYSTTTHGDPGNVAPGSSGYSGLVNETGGSFGTGAFTESITGLTPGVTYYSRSYAKNSVGYSYGSEINFTTLNGPVNLKTVNGLAKNSAKTVNGLSMANTKSFNGLT